MNITCETTNKDFNNKLFDCSLLVVSLLLKQYKANAIDITDFRSHTSVKINYIRTNLDTIKDSMKKRTIERLINECIRIINTN